MTFNDSRDYQDGATFARSYARTYGVVQAVRDLGRLATPRTDAYIAGACDTLLVLVQAGI